MARPASRRLDEFGDGLLLEVAGQAVAGHPVHGGQVGFDRFQDGQQAAGGQHQGVAVGQKDAAHPVAVALAHLADAGQHLVLAAGAEGLLGGGVHLAKGAGIPRAAVGNGQDQGFGFGGRAEDGFDVADQRGVHGGRAG
jgi:hypothetical protein